MPSLMRKINILSRCEGIYRADKLKETDLCACHHSYVLAICNNPGMSQDALAKHICVNKSGVARQIAYLEEKGYVENSNKEHVNETNNKEETKEDITVSLETDTAKQSTNCSSSVSNIKKGRGTNTKVAPVPMSFSN